MCMQLIFADECTEAGGQCYHVNHYVCTECHCPLAGNQYVTLQDSRPYCTACFHSLHADYCSACGRIIAVEQRHVVHSNRKWHDSCFRCDGCDRALVGRSCLLIADGRVFCSGTSCIANQRRDKLLPVDDESRGSDHDVIECEEELVRRRVERRRTINKQLQRLSAGCRIQLASRQTAV